MKITIEGGLVEISALVDAIQKQRSVSTGVKLCSLNLDGQPFTEINLPIAEKK